MKRFLRFVFVTLVALTVGVIRSHAFSTNDLEAEGWTRVSNLTDVSNNYYVLVDAGTSAYAVGRLLNSTDRPVYQNLSDPLGFTGVVWKLNGSSSYTMQSLLDDKYFASGSAGWNDSMTSTLGDDCNFTFSLNNGKFSITSTKTNQLVGPWNNDGAVANNYENVAANKSASQSPGFYIYSISRTEYDAKQITDSYLTSNGWSKVTNNSQLGNTNNYYMFVESVTSGYALARTSNGRPAHKSLSNPFTTPSILWKTESSGNGYKLQSVVDDTYFSCAAGDWNSSMGAHKADIVATINNGVYTLSAGGSNNIGHWQDNTQFPFENESVAGNKNSTNKNTYYIYTISKSDYETQKVNYITSISSSATGSAPANLTSFVINNSDFIVLAKQGWTVSGSWGNQQTGNGAFETWNSTNVSITQSLSNLPGGKYKLNAQIVKGNSSTQANLYFNGDEEYTSAATQLCTSASYDGMKNEILSSSDYALVSLDAHHTSGDVTVGVKVPTGWIVFDNIQLFYYGPTIKSESVPFTSGSNVEANKWYSISIPVSGDYAFTSTVNLNDIVYTFDGMTLIENANSITAHPSEITSLEAGVLYFKVANSANITIEPQSYTYTIGSATISRTCVQGGETVTISWPDAVTNSGEPLAVNTGSVTFNGAALTNPQPTNNGFTFEIPTGLATGSSFVLSIPAGAVGYTNGNTFNTAETFTITTPALFDGTYFLKVSATTADLSTQNTSSEHVGMYLSRGAAWGTHATIDNYGLAFQVSTDENNETLLKIYDTQRYYTTDTNNMYDVWADQSGNKYIITKLGDRLLISAKNSPSKYFKANSGETILYCDGNSSNGTVLLFEAEDAATHASVMSARKDAQAAAVAAAASSDDSAYGSLSGVTTKSGLEAAVANMFSSALVGGQSPTSVSEKYEGAQPNPAPETIYSGSLTIPSPGLYKFSMQAFYRAGGNGRTQSMHTDGVDFPPVVLFFGDSETQIKSLYDESGGTSPYVSGNDAEYNGMYYANNMDAALMMFQEGKYQNEVWAYFPEGGTYNYGVKYLGFANANAQWFIYSPETVTVTYYGNGTIRTENGVVTVYGTNSVADICNALTSDIAVLDLEKATGLDDVQIDNYNNENLLIYAKSTSQVANTFNVIADGVCSNLVLKKSNSPFFVPKAFTATNARYTVAQNDLAGGQYATLMIPFEGYAARGEVYALNQGVKVIGGEIDATVLDAVPANSPVLITGYGQVTGTSSNVAVAAIEKGQTFTNGELVGVYQTTQSPVGSYVLQNHKSSPNGVAFYLVNDVQPNVGPFRAYIKSQNSNVKEMRVNFGESTGIAILDSDGNMTFEGAEYYTVGGTRLNAPQKGMNIVKFSNGTVKKIIIK